MHETAPVSSLIPAPQEMEPETEIEATPSIVTPVDDVQEAPAAVEIDDRKSMEILFGTDTVTGQKLLWMPNDTNQVFHTNTGIIGTMGTGKTQFTKSLITQLYRDQAHNFDGTPLGILRETITKVKRTLSERQKQRSLNRIICRSIRLL